MRTIRVDAPALYPKQHAAIFDASRFSVIEASTKAGKTMGCLIWQINEAFDRIGEHWWVAPIYAQARIAFKRAKGMLPDSIYRANDSRMELELVNGAVWAFRSGDKPDGLYGEDVHSAVIDEASRCKPDAWTAVRSTLTQTRGRARIIGNVKGKKNWFYQMARRAEAGAVGYGYHKLTAWDAVAGGVLAREEIEQARRDVSARVFRELYEAAATDDGANPFGLQAVERNIVEAWAPRLEDVEVWGVDLAKSVDWTFLVGLDAAGHVCYVERFQRSWRQTIAAISDLIGDDPALVDSTGVGDPILEELQARGVGFEGFKFTSSSKQQILEGLAVDLQRDAVTYPDGVLAQELRDFEYVHTRTGVRYSAPEGLHDDGVCALALARALWRRRDFGAEWWR